MQQYRLNYKGDLTGTPTLVTGDGDGTVNARSLKSCEKWTNTKDQKNKAIHSIELTGADHMGVLSDKRVIQYILQILTGSSFYDPIESDKHDYRHQLLKENGGVWERSVPEHDNKL